MPAIYALYVINKSGGLIYNKVRRQVERAQQMLHWSSVEEQACGASFSDLKVHSMLGDLQECVVMASNNLNDTLRLASIW